MRDLIGLYMAHYSGRDTTRVQRLAWWAQQLGQLSLQEVADDHVYAALEALANRPSRYYAGKDAEGQPVYRAKDKAIAPATVNRRRESGRRHHVGHQAPNCAKGPRPPLAFDRAQSREQRAHAVLE